MSPIEYRRSKQRTRILELLNGTKKHPTAQLIYEQLKPDFPHLSLGTVYRNLNILVETGALRKLHYGSAFDRYDARMDPHYHFICSSCDRVYDLPLPPVKSLETKASEITEHTIYSHKVDFFGICRWCKNRSS